MPAHNESEGRNRWRTARERERMHARYAIRSRVRSVDVGLEDSDSVDAENDEPWTEEKITEVLCPLLRHVEQGRTSAFSLSTLSKHHMLLNKPFPLTYVSKFKIQTACTSRFGSAHAQTIQGYADSLENVTIMEYAIWLGEYKLVAPMINGGLNPTMRGSLKRDNGCEESTCARRRRRQLSARVLHRFFDSFPSSLAVYIVKRVVDMRIEHWKENSDCIGCTSCGCRDLAGLSFGAPCYHLFCEQCFWQDLLDHIDSLDDNVSVVSCPVCGLPGAGISTTPAVDTESDCLSTRRHISLERYHSLPATSKELKNLPTRAKRKEVLCSTWRQAVSQSVGSSKDVRRDKFFNYTERNAYHHVKGCLEAGVDVNLTNEYGQTCFFVAAWRGYVKLVKLLLQLGADWTILSNGGVSVINVCKSNGRTDILNVLSEFVGGRCLSRNESTFAKQLRGRGNPPVRMEPELIVLIDRETNHPGAGSYLIDEGISPRCLDFVTVLWQSLPVHSDSKKNVVKHLCAVRSYYCDAEESICALLKEMICQAFESLAAPPQQVLVFPHMRVLHYTHPGSVLAPHVDLARTDVRGNCSTHTFILYLFDCEAGGETFLLRDLTGGSVGGNNILARVSPRRGRLLLFPHCCPHEGNEVGDVPKVLFRGEVMIGP